MVHCLDQIILKFDQAVQRSFLKEFGNLAKTNNTMVIPSNFSDLSSIMASATSVYKASSGKDSLKDSVHRLNN